MSTSIQQPTESGWIKPSEALYRIEKRSDDATEYWAQSGSGRHYWNPNKSRAEVYSESERREFLNRELRGEVNKFPSGGVWVRLEAEREAA